mmetsp:Transcript_86508/g.231875  ORF Transcript_86508/g.231875 Transcript_86508/m.231875 type:complete len:463 (-) Transcript_86508:44-1432(-)
MAVKVHMISWARRRWEECTGSASIGSGRQLSGSSSSSEMSDKSAISRSCQATGSVPTPPSSSNSPPSSSVSMVTTTRTVSFRFLKYSLMGALAASSITPWLSTCCSARMVLTYTSITLLVVAPKIRTRLLIWSVRVWTNSFCCPVTARHFLKSRSAASDSGNPRITSNTFVSRKDRKSRISPYTALRAAILHAAHRGQVDRSCSPAEAAGSPYTKRSHPKTWRQTQPTKSPNTGCSEHRSSPTSWMKDLMDSWRWNWAKSPHHPWHPTLQRASEISWQVAACGLTATVDPGATASGMLTSPSVASSPAIISSSIEASSSFQSVTPSKAAEAARCTDSKYLGISGTSCQPWEPRQIHPTCFPSFAFTACCLGARFTVDTAATWSRRAWWLARAACRARAALSKPMPYCSSAPPTIGVRATSRNAGTSCFCQHAVKTDTRYSHKNSASPASSSSARSSSPRSCS